ncbi:Putative Integral membrane protein [Penicillium brasilianum]|uniref:Putative Integral membrane protein n=1 Tax=Penicillium brasilianum TaxID=104259 RepID=A0A0F7TB38_PENBI|nr:Putative Integral membrane protein [Penicillium brasilianum]
MEPAVRLSLRDKHFRMRVLKPILRAYALGYLSSVTPKLVTFVRRLRSQDWSFRQKIQELAHVLAGPLRINSFPTFCAALIGGSTLFPVLLYRIYASIAASLFQGDTRISQKANRLIRFATALLSALISFDLLNKHRTISRQDVRARRLSSVQVEPANELANALERPHPELVGRTMDLTIFTVTRAMDVVACMAWSHWARRRKAQNRWTIVESYVPGLADAGVFAMSAAVVMWAWFYLPERLPRTYEKWIGEVAKVDTRLIEALRRARRGKFVYGKDTGQAPLLESMCRDFGWPEVWGDPSKTIPIPCEMVHMGCGPNCEIHAVSRFARTFKIACATYIPLQIVLRLRKMKDRAVLGRAISEGAQSSAFLATFVSLFYYAVCLARTRIGPKVFDQKTVTPLMWDSGLCVGAGCLMCGWSVLVEQARKRQELALFVAPRAVATVLPRLYEKKYQHRERIAFAVSAAILLTTLRERPRLIRGVFGRITAGVLN